MLPHKRNSFETERTEEHLNAKNPKTYASNYMLTPETRKLLTLCKEIEFDISKYHDNENETAELKKLLSKTSEENVDLTRKILQLEMENIEKDNQLKKLSACQNESQSSTKVENIKYEQIQNINTLRKTILNLKEENRQFSHLSSNLCILQEKLKDYQDTINRQNKEIETYKNWVNNDRFELSNQLNSSKSNIDQMNSQFENLKKENTFLKEQWQSSDKLYHELINKYNDLQSLCDNLQKKDRESSIYINDTKSQLARALKMRDGYKEILDSYNQFSFSDSNLEKALRERINMLESHYLGLEGEISKLEVANLILKSVENDRISTDNLCSKCQHSIQKLPSITSETEDNANRILHLSNNPNEIYTKTITQKFEDACSQNQKLIQSLQLLSCDINNNSTLSKTETLQKIHRLISSLPSTGEFNRIKEESNKYKTLSARYKQACAEKITSLRSDYIKLLGYGLEYQTQDNYLRLTSVYSQDQDQHLIFKKSVDGKSFEIVPNNFWHQISEHFKEYNELPALNSAVNLYLYGFKSKI